MTENPAVGATEVWEFYNGTEDAHPMHIHEILFQVVDRQAILVDEANKTFQVVPGSAPQPPEPWENGCQGHRHRLPGPGDPRAGAVQHPGPVRLALPHRRARGQRDDAAVPDRAGAAEPARLRTVAIAYRRQRVIRAKQAARRRGLPTARSGSVCLNNFPRSISGLRAVRRRCRVVHGGVRRLRRTQSRGGQLGRTRVSSYAARRMGGSAARYCSSGVMRPRLE